jgi:uroporphyrinogen-III synthase
MKVLILRPAELLPKTVELLRKEGFEAHGCPFIELEFLDFDVPEHDYAIITSQNAAMAIVERGFRLGKVIAIGKKTAEILRNAGYDVVMPSKFDSETLFKEFSAILRGKKVVAIRSDAGSEAIKKLAEVSEFLEIKAYRIKKLQGKKQIEEVRKVAESFYDAVVLSSSMIARSFLELCERFECIDRLEKVHIIAIGPPTARVIEGYGIKALIPDEYTFDGVIRLLKILKDGDFQC